MAARVNRVDRAREFLSLFCTAILFLVCFAAVASAQSAKKSKTNETPLPAVDAQIAADNPIAFWTFDGEDAFASVGAIESTGKRQGAVSALASDLRSPAYPLYEKGNRVCQLDGGFLRVADTDPRFDFANGDEITLEAYVQTGAIGDGKQVYVIGKGRTNNAGFPKENQNYALRITGSGGSAMLSFLFRNEANRTRDDFHRWTSTEGFAIDGRWHHIAVTYRFGDPKSIRGYVDGASVSGVWDIGGETEKKPLIDDDEIWIGSSIGGASACTLHGFVDSVAIHRSMISAERMSQRYRAAKAPPFDIELARSKTPKNAVLVELFERVPEKAWSVIQRAPDQAYQLPAMAANDVAAKYSRSGVIADRSNPFRMRLQAIKELPAGEYRILLRSRNAARLHINDKLVAELGFMKRNSSGHEEVPGLVESEEGVHAAPPGHQEKLFDLKLDGTASLWRLETIVGGKGLRAELGELAVAIAKVDEPFEIVMAEGESPVAFDEIGWDEFQASLMARLDQVNAAERAESSLQYAEFWRKRHDIARDEIDSLGPIVEPRGGDELPRFNQVDQYINARLAEAGVMPAPLTDDHAFLRRVALDLVGRNPTTAELEAFAEDSEPRRRSRAIKRLLAAPGWADNWMGYWQDVLAENPGILKPKLNNTGPFRWWIYESFRDNKPMDRFVTELIMMEGSVYAGGPAGFALATQNDVPTAAKAHVLSQAFLGVEMKCARCHDAPFHPYQQKQLFSIAAMLNRQTLTLPKTSTAPANDEGRESLITVSLRPGQKIGAEWPFEQFAKTTDVTPLMRNPTDSRERLAALITSAQNRRFAMVMVNRLWARYLGWGLVDPVDDWHDAEPSHPKLLDYLAREFVASGYDLKHVASLIVNSHAYQRVATDDGSRERDPHERLFASPRRRRLSAEQVVDALLHASGKVMASEPLTLDPEGRRSASTFLNLGVPNRAWELTSLSNERDRPALALPAAQSVIDVLLAFGWRDSRPSPISVRDETPTILQPLTIANGVLGAKISRLSDNSRFTELALTASTPDELVDQMFWLILARPATTEEREPLARFLDDGFGDRKTGAPRRLPERVRTAVSWSNHLNAEATKIKMALEKQIREGEPGSPRLTDKWRERAEDVVWAIANSPEFVFVP